MIRVPEPAPALVAVFRDGDDDSFARISQHYFRELHVHCCRKVGCVDEAEGRGTSYFGGLDATILFVIYS